MMNVPLPEGCVHIDIPKAKQICTKMDIDFVPAVVGFEKGGSGRSHPCIYGVVTFKEYAPRIRQEYKQILKVEKQRKAEKASKTAKQTWK